MGDSLIAIPWKSFPLKQPIHPAIKTKMISAIDNFSALIKYDWMFDNSTKVDNRYTHVLLWHDEDIKNYEDFLEGKSPTYVVSRKKIKLSNKTVTEEPQGGSKIDNTDYIDKIGEQNPHSKLTNDEVVAIIASDDSMTLLAEKYDVGYSSVWQIKKNKTWKHLPR